MTEESLDSSANSALFKIDRYSGKQRKLSQSDIPRLTDAEHCCVTLISEFLQSYDFMTTVETFNKECTEMKMVSCKTFVKKDRIKKETVVKILEYFTNNDQKSFFEAWESLIPPSFHQEMDYKKLTFYLHVHFAVLPLRCPPASVQNHVSDSKEDASSGVKENLLKDGSKGVEDNESSAKNNNEEVSCDNMETLKNFLETKGREFSKEPEFLPYYALPFVTDPTTHPSFRDVFSDSWVIRLRDSIEEFLLENCWGSHVAPELLHICSRLLQGQCLQPSHSQLLDLHKSYQHLRRRFHKINRDHHSLIGIATELTSALESSVKGQAVDLKSTLDNCMRIFPEIFRLSLQSSEVISQEPSHHNGDELGLTGNFDLDFRKVKHHLITGSVKTKLLLLQALRWRITRNNVEERDLIAMSYLRHDILCLQPVGTPCESCKSADRPPLLLESFFTPPDVDTPHPLQQAAARLVNSLASLRCGRDYLCSARCGLLKVFIDCLKGENNIKIDSHTQVMIIATLQKLSLRYSQRMGMIRFELVEWLILHLNSESRNMKLYCLEYSTALLMNLCLHRKAKERCVPLARTVLRLLTGLLGTQVYHAIPYINGTLYSLLGNDHINREARKMGLCKILEYYLKHSEGEMHRQLEHILSLHRRDCQPDGNVTSDEENEDDIEDVILLEEELDADDPVRSGHGELHGEQLLYQQYRLVFPHHVLAHPSSSTWHPGEVLKRPTTPRRTELKNIEPSPPPLLTGSDFDDLDETETPVEKQHSRVETVTENNVAADTAQEDNISVEVVIENTITEEVESLSKETTLVQEIVENGTPIEREIKVEEQNEKKGKSTPAIEEGNEDYSKAFSSRPRIPRTPTHNRSS